MKEEHLSSALRELVKTSVAQLGEVIRNKLGDLAFLRIEQTRKSMAALREESTSKTMGILTVQLRMLQGLNQHQQLDFARAYTLMLELMNACENAYRSHQIRKKAYPFLRNRPDSIIYVLTAHPTETRSPQNIWVFHVIQQILIQALDGKSADHLRHWLEVAWNTSTTRIRKPRVHDEAEHIYSTLLREETLRTLLEAGKELAPIYIRSWVGGDKDGHPGVNEREFLDSLQLSRRLICCFIHRRLDEVRETTEAMKAKRLDSYFQQVKKNLNLIKSISPGDAHQIRLFKKTLRTLSQHYKQKVGDVHPSLAELHQLQRIFPALVVPLEFRESSDVLMSQSKWKDLNICQMLKALAKVSRGGDPRWYVRGLIVSMTDEFKHLQVAAHLVSSLIGGLQIPIIPLFEKASALEKAPQIVEEMLENPEFLNALKSNWDGYLEVMLGYSDSSKESGVFPSRLKIAKTMNLLDQMISNRGITPLFFHGSGGSIDRGGGTIQEQTAWWPSGALRNYKVTLQGEMIERSLASPEITRRQLERIVENGGRWKDLSSKNHPIYIDRKIMETFANRITESYQRMIRSPDFIQLVEQATPYRFLSALKIGSRPAKRGSQFSIESLRAIPWVLCWTQTRTFFPIWWGVGSAWTLTRSREKRLLKLAYQSDPLFSTFVRALGFTLAKVQLPIWRMYLNQSLLSKELRERAWVQFCTEHQLALNFAHSILGKKGFLSWRPWLRESIALRSPMIHPLNLLQVIALKNQDIELLKMTVIGISSGMMTTG